MVDRYRAMLVDDVPELRRLLRHVLEWSDRFEVVGEADNGRIAVQLAGELTPDLVLLDISMPVMDGMEALPRIVETSPQTKVVMLSGFEAERLGQAAMEMGAAGYIEKGTAPAQLMSKLLTILDGEAAQEDLSVAAPGSSAAAVRDAATGSLGDFSQEEMMSLVAHEIRNPLAVIQGFGMELMNRWEAMPEHVRKDAVRRMTERARYLNTVVSNLMYMRKLSGAPEWVQASSEAVAPLLERIHEELRDIARDNVLLLEIPDDLPRLKVNVQRLRQVLTNLVVNASKFSPKGTSIRLTAGAHDHGIAIKVVDEGPGIPPESREEIFEKFKRLDSGGSGIGLGLYISRALMRSMDGDLIADESASGGACMVCLLPLAEEGEGT